jgi:UrcA family protein
MKQFLRTMCLPAVLLAAATPALAQDPAQGSADITAMGRTELRHDWLNLHGPDAQGNVVARVNTADLDLTTAAGRAERDRRIGHASTDLCRATLDDPEFPVSQAAAERSCQRSARNQAARQTEQVRQAAR